MQQNLSRVLGSGPECLLGQHLRSGFKLALLCVVLSGCGTTRHPLTASFDELTNDSTTERSLLFNYHNFVSISGLAPPHVIGTLEHAPGGLSPSHAIGVSPKWSYIVQNDYEMPPETLKAVSASSVKSLYLKAARAASELTKAEADLVAATLVAGEASLKPSVEKQGFLNSALAMIGAACSDKEKCSDQDLAKAEKERQAARDTAKKKVDEADEALTNALSGTNIIITRWNVATAGGATIEAADLAKASAAGQKTRSGVAIFGGIRVIKLFAGEDFLDMVRNFARDSATSFGLGSVGVTTFAIQAQQVEYISDQELEARAELSAALSVAQLSQLSQILTTIKPDTAVAMQLGVRTSSLLGNSGRLSGPKTKVIDVSFFPSTAYQEFQKIAYRLNDGYSTVFAVRATTPIFLSWASQSGKLVTDLSRGLEQCKEQRKKGESCTALASWVSRCNDQLARFQGDAPPGKLAEREAAKGYLLASLNGETAGSPTSGPKIGSSLCDLPADAR